MQQGPVVVMRLQVELPVQLKDVSTNTIVAADAAENVNSLPAKYDLRDRYRVPTIRDQGKLGTCWAFGAISALESSLMWLEARIHPVSGMFSTPTERSRYTQRTGAAKILYMVL